MSRDVLKLPQGSPSEFNKKLHEVQLRKVKLLTLPEPTSECPLRIQIVDDADFVLLQANDSLSLKIYKHNGIEYLHGTSNLSAIQLMGSMVSCWDVNDSQTKPHVTFEFVCQMYETVGEGHSDRVCAQCVGTNVCFGPRCSNRPKPSPNSGTGENIYESSYYRQSYELPQAQAIIEAQVDALGGNIVMLARSVNSNIFNFLGPEVCSKNIWTQGYPSSKQGKRGKKQCPVLGFANDPHLDKCDLLSEELQMKWMLEVNEVLFNSKDPFAKQVCEKLVDLQESLGLGLPTTCGCICCHENEQDAGCDSIQQHFACDGLGISVPIVDLSVHHFYGWAFVHRTSLCLRILDNTVYTRNSEEKKDFVLAAWGRSGGSAEATRNAGTRRRRSSA